MIDFVKAGLWKWYIQGYITYHIINFLTQYRDDTGSKLYYKKSNLKFYNTDIPK